MKLISAIFTEGVTTNSLPRQSMVSTLVLWCFFFGGKRGDSDKRSRSPNYERKDINLSIKDLSEDPDFDLVSTAGANRISMPEQQQATLKKKARIIRVMSIIMEILCFHVKSLLL
jgi:hypothetical protein